MKAYIVSDGTEEPAFDIVAVHGLGGDPWETWTHSNTKICWIKDFLPQDCKGARIITFGYDSALIAERLVQNIQDLAMQLMRHLDVLRADCPSRPLVFIAHSLGGILVKDALALAKDDKVCAETIFSGTKGILFFGTPHRGSTAAQLANQVARVASFCLVRPHNDVVQGLRKGSETLQRINEQFRVSYSNWELVSFIESEPTPHLNGLVVEQWSARLDYHNEVPVPVSETHSNICKVGTRDGLYQVILRQIKRIGGKTSENHDEVGVTVFPRGRSLHTHYVDRPTLNEDIENFRVKSSKPEPKTCLIYGIGGSGKSQACIKYFQDGEKEFHHRFWIDASSDTTLQQSFALIADTVDPRLSDQSPSHVLNWIQKRKRRWLMVLDDVPNDVKILELIPRLGNGFILLSAQISIQFIHIQLPVGDLSLSSTSNLLLTICGMDKLDPDHQFNAKTLVKLLKQHPLAVCVAGAFIRNNKHMTIREYISQWEDCVFEDYEGWSDDPTGTNRSLGRTFTMTLNEIANKNKETKEIKEIKETKKTKETKVTASDLLKLLAFFHQEHVSMRIFHEAWKFREALPAKSLNQAHYQQTWMRVLEPASSHGWKEAKTDLQAALTLLQKFSLLDLVTDPGNTAPKYDSPKWPAIGVHSLVHIWVLREMTESEKREWLVKAATILAANFQKEEAMSHDIVSHLDHVRDKASIENIFRPQCYISEVEYFIADCFADIYKRQGYFKQAKDIRERICSHLGRSQDIIHLVDSIGALADSCADLGEDQEAYKLRKEALEIADQHSIDEDFTLYLHWKRDFAQSAHILGYHDQALALRNQLCDRIRNYLRQISRDSHKLRAYLLEQYLICQRQRAVSLHTLERWDEAVSILEELVSKQEVRPADPELLLSRGSLADAYSRVGKHDKALKQREEVLRQRKQISERHPDTLIARECVAQSYLTMGDLDNALYMRMETLDEWRDHNEQLPKDYPQLLEAKLNLAQNYQMMDNWEMALEHYEDVYECKLEVVRSFHLRQCRSQRCAGKENVLLCRETYEGVRADLAIEALEGQACALYRLNKQEEASEKARTVGQIWKIQLDVAPQQRPDFLESKNTLATIIPNEAERIRCREGILAEQLKNGQDKRTGTLKTMLSLGGDYFDKRNFEKAYKHLDFVLKHGQGLRLSLHREFEDAQSKCREARSILEASGAASSYEPQRNRPQNVPLQHAQSFQRGSSTNQRQGRRAPIFEDPFPSLFRRF